MATPTIKIHKKGNDGYSVISVRIKETTLNKLDEISRQSNRSRNEIINIILDSSIESIEIN